MPTRPVNPDRRHCAGLVRAQLSVQPFRDIPATSCSHKLVLPVAIDARMTVRRGSGEVDVVYLDDSLRVFRSKGSVVVQVRADLLSDQ